MKILCPGGYTWHNKGDAALVLAMLGELGRSFPDAELSLISDSPQLDAAHYGVAVLPPLFGDTTEADRPAARRGPPTPLDRLRATLVYRHYIAWRVGALQRRLQQRFAAPLMRLRFHLAMAWLFLTIATLGRQCHRVAPAGRRQTLRAICEADAIIFVPGGYLIAPHAGHVYWFRHLAALFAARWLARPIFLYACTIGPFHGRHNAWLARRALALPDLVFLREQSSFEATRRIAPRVEAVLTADAGFLLDACSAERTQELRREHLRDDGRTRVGISVREYHFPGHPDAAGQHSRYLQAMAKLADHLIERHGACVYFVPQVIADEPSDLVVSRQIGLQVARREHVVVIEEDLDPRELKGLYGSMDAFVGVRMHANIFALSAGVPTVAIAYEPKTLGIMQQLGLQAFALDIRTLDAEGLIACADKLLADLDGVKATLRRTVPAVEATAMRTADTIAAHLNAGRSAPSAGPQP